VPRVRRSLAIGFVLLSASAAAFWLPSAARAACATTATPLRGSAPLTVTFTATCASAAYTWRFGDGQQGQGQTVQHVYAAGSWTPTLTTDAGTDTLPAVTSISLVLTGPKEAKYAQWITLHVSVTPAVPIEVRGHRARGGTVRFRALSTEPYVALGGGVRSAPLHVALVPTISLSLRGTTVFGGSAHAVAVLHPAGAGSVKLTVDGKPGDRIDTRRLHTAVVVATSTPAPGWVAAKRSLSIAVAQPTLSVGAQSLAVAELETDLGQLHYLVPARSTTFTPDLVDSIYAFQKINHLARTGMADAATWKALEHPAIPEPRYKTPGLHVEIDKELQVLFVVRDSQITQISPVSTAGLPGRFTPVGQFGVYRKVDGFDPSPLGTLYLPSYFTGGYAIHGNPSVPPYPASHGCVRVPMWIAPTMFAELVIGTPVDVY
jgi:N-acetylmuramoyl-L-alanine amidase